MSRKKKKSKAWGGLVLVILVIMSVVVWRMVVGLGEGGRVVFVNNDQVEVRQLSIEQDRGVKINLPAHLMVPVKGMQGRLRLKSMIKFADDEGEPFDIVRRSVEILLGSQTDGVIYQVEGSNIRQLIYKKSDMGVIKRITWLWQWGRLEKNKVQEIDWPTSLGDEEQRPDGTEIIVVERDAAWDFSHEYLGTGRLRDGNVGVRVVNASGWQGLGYLATTMLEIEGAVVVDVEAQERQEGLCTVTYKQKNEIVDWIKDKWSCKGEESEVEDVIVVLKGNWGEKYQREM